MNPPAALAAVNDAVVAEALAFGPLGPRWDLYSPQSTDNVAARDAVFQLLSLRGALQRLGRPGASTLLAGMARAATGGPVEVHYPVFFECPPTATPPYARRA